MGKLLEMYGIEPSIDISGGTGQPTFTAFGDGIENLAEQLNEVVYSGFFLSDKGYGNSEVTAMQPVFTFTGKRVVGDEVQDYIFSKKYALGAERKTILKVTCNGITNQTFTVPVTISNMQEYSGNTQDISAISFELRFNGKPVIEKNPTV